MPLTAADVDRFERSRRRLEAIAYRLLGSADEAQDAVQETFLRWQAADVDRIEVPEAWPFCGGPVVLGSVLIVLPAILRAAGLLSGS